MLKARQRLGKYRIERRVSSGGFADVYRALDTIEGVRVALKVPHPHLLTKELLEDFRNEVRLMARLDHVNILPLKDASVVQSHFVIVFPLGERTLADRLTEMRPELKVLFMSGYTADAIDRHGVLDPGVAFLPKPFKTSELLTKIQSVLSA